MDFHTSWLLQSRLRTSLSIVVEIDSMETEGNSGELRTPENRVALTTCQDLASRDSHATHKMDRLDLRPRPSEKKGKPFGLGVSQKPLLVPLCHISQSSFLYSLCDVHPF